MHPFGKLLNSLPVSRFLAIALGLCAAIVSSSPSSAIEERNVLVLYNADQGTSGVGYEIANYYRQVRPDVHLLGLTGINALLSGSTSETISADDYLNVIRPQVLAGIAQLPDSIDVLVTTKGLPLKIDAGVKGPDSTAQIWRRYSSLESELTRIDTITTRDQMGDQFIFTGFPDLDPTPSSNPYYNANAPFIRAGSDPVNGDIRLAARLDGFDLEAIKGSIDRAQKAYILPRATYVVADDDPSASTDQMINNIPGGPGPGLVSVVNSAGQSILYENTNDAIVTAPGRVLGYVSHGTADGAGGLENQYVSNQLQFELANGSVFLTHESWNAASFHPSYVSSQGLVADWLRVGGTAGLGHVNEPFNGPDNVANEDLFFANMIPRPGSAPGTAGRTLVESAWIATRQLSYVNTVVGDPLMTWKVGLPGDANLDGKVEFKDFYALEGNWLSSGDYSTGDFNGDGLVNSADFEVLAANWLSSISPGGNNPFIHQFEVLPVLDDTTGVPRLKARLLSDANFDGDMDVDGADLAVIQAAYGKNGLGDVDGDGDTDGRDFLAWQRMYLKYDFTADFEIDAVVGAGDLSVWQTSYNNNRGGDADGDGDTDGRDFLAWQRQYNAPVAQAASSLITVPEPLGLSMLGATVLLMSGLRPSRRFSCLPSFAH